MEVILGFNMEPEYHKAIYITRYSDWIWAGWSGD